ncbi:MAG: DMT family transporter [Rhodobacteraceae bacterium]|nr:DMT family transporter [Paracoccaceae bacterium]
MTRHPFFGLGLATFGALILTPDTMFMRWSDMGGFQMLAWRGLTMGGLLLILWLGSGAPGRAALTTRTGAAIIGCHMVNATLFSLGIAVAPVPVVLFAVAVSPVFAALFAWAIAGETAGRATWITTAAVLAGIFVAILGRDTGGVGFNLASALGAAAGLGVAASLALTFVILRKARDIPILPAIGGGSFLAGMAGLVLAGGPAAMLEGQVWAIAVTGLVILPASFLALTFASRHTSAANVSLLMLLETVLGPIWVWAFAGEPLTLPMLIGGAIVIGSLAIFLVVTGRGRRPTPRAQ